MSERIRGSYDDALYKSTYTLLYFTLGRLPAARSRRITLLPRPGSRPKYCYQRVRVFVCLLANPKNHTSIFSVYMLPVAVARSSSDGNATRC